MGKKNKLFEKDENLIACKFISKEGNRECGYIRNIDIQNDGSVEIFVYEKKNKNGKKELVYTSNKKEYDDVLENQNIIEASVLN